MKNLSVNMRAIAFILLTFACYNSADAFLKKAQDYYSFAESALYPVIAYLIFTVIFSKKLGSLKEIPKSNRKSLHFIRAGFGTLCFVSMVLSFKFITLGEAYTLLLTAPFWIAILSQYFFKEKIGWHRWLAIIVGFIGVFTVLRPGFIEISVFSLLPLIAAFGFSMFVILTKKIGPNEPLINMVLYPIFTDIIVLIPIIFFMGNWTPPQFEHFILFIMSGGLYLIGTTLSSLGYASGESSLLAPIQYSQILWGLIIGYFIFSETPEIWTLIGAIIIVLSGIYLIHREHKAEQQK